MTEQTNEEETSADVTPSASEIVSQLKARVEARFGTDDPELVTLLDKFLLVVDPDDSDSSKLLKKLTVVADKRATAAGEPDIDDD